MKRIILTGGGTAGHVTPHIALIPALKERGFDLHYVGRVAGIERELIEPLGLPYAGISAGKLRRYFDWQNFADLFRIGRGFIQALFLVRQLRPVVVFSKGGFVSCPVVWAAWLNRVPVVLHESDLTPGLANKLSLPFAGRVCYSFPETEAALSPGKAIYTGIPIRPALLAGDAAEGRRLCGFDEVRPAILVMGGSQGAAVINDTVRAALDDLLTRFQVCHLCGRGAVEPGLAGKPGYKQFEYAGDELPHLLAMAGLVVSRAGATTLFELLALHKPTLLIPLSRQASRGDQIHNARSFERQGFSRVLPEEDLNADSLVRAVSQTYAGRAALVEAMRPAGAVNGVSKVVGVIESCLEDG